MRCTNGTLLFSNCSGISMDHIYQLALVRGAVGMFCFLLCLATFLFELVYICRRKNSTTLQRLFVYLTFSNLLYTAALSLHMEHYFSYGQQVQCYICRAIGFFDQYTGSVQLLLTLGIAVKLFHKVFSFCCRRQKVTKGCLSRHHFLWEALFFVVCFVLPCTVIWYPFMVDGPGGYGIEGPWCWIEVLKGNCEVSNGAFLEQLLLWYVPYVAVSVMSLFCIAAIVGFLIYICLRHYNKNRKKVMVVILDMLLLMPFLVVFCCVCLVEISIAVLLRIDALNGRLNNYIMWMFYAVTTPIGGVIIPIAFFFYFLRKKSQSAPQKLLHVSGGRATMQHSDRRSVNSCTSQQEDRPKFLSHSDVGWDTSTDSAVVVEQILGESQRTKYGSINI